MRLKSAERAGHAVGPPPPMHCSGKMFFKNSRILVCRTMPYKRSGRTGRWKTWSTSPIRSGGRI